MKGLYIHIPFCKAICTYCDFPKEIAVPTKQNAYLEALKKEFKYYHNELKDIDTLYIGGGTPSSLSETQLSELFKTIQTFVNLDKVQEFTIEANPNDITLEKAQIFKQEGINRVSLGVQTFNETSLKNLNRKHTNRDVINAIKYLRQAKILNINLDLIFNLPNQTLNDVENDLKEALKLNVEHIAYYSLIIEENTKLYYDVLNKKITINDEDIEASMYETIIDTLTNGNYQHYEISNYAKKGYASKHNLIYWHNDDYIGIGAGAHGKYQNTRYFNTRSVKYYIENVTQHLHGKEEDYLYEPLRDTLIMGLRLSEGIDLVSINQSFNLDLLKTYPKLNYYIKEGLLSLNKDKLALTRKGILLGNEIFALF